MVPNYVSRRGDCAPTANYVSSCLKYSEKGFGPSIRLAKLVLPSSFSLLLCSHSLGLPADFCFGSRTWKFVCPWKGSVSATPTAGKCETATRDPKRCKRGINLGEIEEGFANNRYPLSSVHRSPHCPRGLEISPPFAGPASRCP